MTNKFKAHFRGRKAMVTGGLGFIGSNLARALVKSGADVLIVDAFVPGHGGNIFNIRDFKDKVKVRICDIRDISRMRPLVKGQDYIFNLAGQVSHIDSMKDPFTDLDMNCRSHVSLLETCRKYNPELKIIFASTRQIYGRPAYLPVDEKHLSLPTDVNGINKMAGEWYHILYHNVYGIRAVALRLTNTYGPGLLVKHNRQGFIGWFIRQAIDNEEIRIFGDGRQVRDFSYVDDAVEAFLIAAARKEADGKIYNIGGSERMNLTDFVRMIISICGRGSYRIVPFPEEKKKIDIGDYYSNFSKITAELGWRPRVHLKEGLTKTIAYYTENKKHYWK